jgi:GT2 family glycosyltransferase
MISLYRKLKYSSVWQKNRFARGSVPLLRFIKRVALRPFLPIIFRIRSQKNKTIRENPEIKILNSARAACENNDWPEAKTAYEFLLELDLKNPIKIENRNEAKFQISFINRLTNFSKYKKEIALYNKEKQKKKPKIAIFTAISGGYDTLKLPAVLNPKFDYILFTDTSTKDFGIFKVRPLPYFHEDSTRRARFVKTHPHLLLPEYDYAIWVDANILIIEDIMPMFEDFKKSDKPIGAIRHPLRDSVYEETRECIKRSKEDAAKIQEQEDHYRELGFDCDDLIESNIMMIDLKNEKIPDFYATWWTEIDAFTRRDQLSLGYSLSKHDISWHRIMDRPQNARNHPYFALVPHHTRQTPLLELEKLFDQKPINPNHGPSFFSKKKELLSNKNVKEKGIDIIYCVHNALEDVKLCLDSVVRHHKPNENLIIIDDGSESETKKFLEEFAKKHKKWTLLNRSETGSGYTKAANRGLKLSSADLAILLNSDTIVTADWTAKMAHAVFTTPGAGIVGPLSSAASHQSIPNHKSSDGQTATNELPKGLSADDINNYCENWSVASLYPRVPLVHGFCYGITRDTIEKIGYFDEKNFAKGYGEENAYCFKAVDAGIGLVIATNTYIFHAKSKSYIGPERIKLMKSGNERLAEIYGKERVRRAVLSMQQNPILEKLRNKTSELYSRIEAQHEKDKKHLKEVLNKYYNYSPDEQQGKTVIDLVLQNGETHPTSSAFIRLISPLTLPESKERYSVYLHDGSNYKPSPATDVCIIQRTAIPTLHQAQEIIQELSKNRVKLIIDVDDLFSSIGEYHPEYHSQLSKIDALNLLVSSSDVLTTSTKEVADSFNHPNKVIMANCLDFRIWELQKPQSKSEKNPLQLLYMGTSTHQEDFNLILPSLDKLHAKHPDSFRLTIIGIGINDIKRPYIINLTEKIPSSIYPEFINWLQQQGPFHIGLAPLVDNKFNRAKSDIKLLDYIALGALPVASDINPYSRSNFSETIRTKNFALILQKLLTDNCNEWSGIASLQKQLSNQRKISKVLEDLTNVI